MNYQMNISPVKLFPDENYSLNQRKSPSHHSSRLSHHHTFSHQNPHANSNPKLSSKPSSPDKSPHNKSYTFKRQQSIKGRTLPPSFVISNMVKPISQQPLNPYWKQTSQHQLIGILSDESKYKRFMQGLESDNDNDAEFDDARYLNSILGLLLMKVKENNPSINQEKDGFGIEFDKGIALENEVRIDGLRKELAEKDKLMNKVEEEYREIVKNYVEVIDEVERDQEFAEGFEDSQY